MSRLKLKEKRRHQLWQKTKDTYDMAIFRQNERIWEEKIGEAIDRMNSDDNGLKTLAVYDIKKEYKQQNVSTTGLRKI